MRLLILTISFLVLTEAVQVYPTKPAKHHRHRIYRHHHQQEYHNSHDLSHEDCCFDAVKGKDGSPPKFIRKHDCSSYMAPSPATTTITVTVTSEVTEYETIASMTAFHPPQPPVGCKGIPGYAAKPCMCDPSKYSSACSKWGITTGVYYQPTETITTTVTKLATVSGGSYDPYVTLGASSTSTTPEPSSETITEASSLETGSVIIGTASALSESTSLPSTPTPHIPVSPLIQRCSKPLVCDNISSCSTTPGSCLCQPSVHGEGFCLMDRPCSTLTDCKRDEDCEDGSTCMLTCCAEPKCLELPWLCVDHTAPMRMFAKRARRDDGGMRVVRRALEGEVVLDRWTGHIVVDGPSGGRSDVGM